MDTRLLIEVKFGIIVVFYLQITKLENHQGLSAI